MTKQALFEIMPTQQVKEKSIQEYYSNEAERDKLEMNGFTIQNPLALSGYAIKTIREIVCNVM